MNKTINADCPTAKYTNRKFINKGTKLTDDDTTEDVYWNSFGNGWSDDGRKRYCDLMLTINESRAFYNTSFDKRMKNYVNQCEAQAAQRRKKRKTSAFTYYTADTLPSVEEVLQNNGSEQKTNLNLELMQFVDDFDDSNVAAL